MELSFRLKMQMAHQPDDRQPEGDHQHEKNDPALPPFFPERFPAATGAAFVSPAGVLERDRNIEPAPSFARSFQEFFALPPCRFLGHPRRFRDHALQFFHLAAQLRLALREFILFLVKRRPGLRRSAAHAELLGLRRDPKEHQQR